MGLLAWVHWVHLLAVSVWTGGLVVLAALIVTLRRAGADIELLRSVARQFARVSWTAMVVACVTGLWQVHLMRMSWSYGRLHLKLGLVALVVATALVHQLTARRASAAVRGITQLAILVLSVLIFGAATWLRG